MLPISDINATPPWPRRATRACASCRRDKIRCDGGRPCTGCTKKGYTPDQCVHGCDPCRRARVRCEDGKPCQRCRDLQIECTEEPTMPVVRQDAVVLPIRAPRTNIAERAKVACVNCRRDNKKCDNQRPCSRCIARSEACVHVGRGPKLVKLRCEGCRQNKQRCEDARPCRFCVEAQRQCVTTPRRGRGHGTRVKAACLNCRRDKIRCDGVRPCASCVRKGYECIERACKVCAREGRAAECNHRPDCVTSDVSVTAGAASTSTSTPSMLPPPSYPLAPSFPEPPLHGYAYSLFNDAPSTSFRHPYVSVIDPSLPSSSSLS